MLEFPPEEEFNDKSLIQIWELAAERLRKRAASRKQKFDSKFQPLVLKVGDPVLIKAHRLSSAKDAVIKKFFALYEGLFYIGKIVGANSYEVVEASGQVHSIQNIVNLKLFKSMPTVDLGN